MGTTTFGKKVAQTARPFKSGGSLSEIPPPQRKAVDHIATVLAMKPASSSSGTIPTITSSGAPTPPSGAPATSTPATSSGPGAPAPSAPPSTGSVNPTGAGSTSMVPPPSTNNISGSTPSPTVSTFGPRLPPPRPPPPSLNSTR
eukprot:TRINITY_DN6068_c0_g1_i1.p1 TRINITY_DN6068_c0_g1~~TRINITY_DN6068_c0_g1_i1.p1  ORF type:complete len:167 (-),score=50.75 TRINITY_DN6068_c0_g1_i1:109-540(-)